MSVFGVILIRIFPAFYCTRTEYGVSKYSFRMQENARKMRTRKIWIQTLLENCFWKTGPFHIWKITFQEISWKDFAKYKRSYIYRRKEKTYSRYCKSYLLYLDMLSKSKSKFTWMGMSSQWVKESFMAYHSLIRHFTEQYRFFWDETVILRRKKLHLIRQKCFTNLTSNHHSDKMI